MENPNYPEKHPPSFYYPFIDRILHRYGLPLLEDGDAMTTGWTVSVVCSTVQIDSINCGPCVLMKIWETLDPSTCPLNLDPPPPIEMYRQLIYNELKKNMEMLGLAPLFHKAVPSSQPSVVLLD